jgi:hypothetical protein
MYCANTVVVTCLEAPQCIAHTHSQYAHGHRFHHSRRRFAVSESVREQQDVTHVSPPLQNARTAQNTAQRAAPYVFKCLVYMRLITSLMWLAMSRTVSIAVMVEEAFYRYSSINQCHRFLKSQLFRSGVCFLVQVAGQNNKSYFVRNLSIANKLSSLALSRTLMSACAKSDKSSRSRCMIWMREMQLQRWTCW